VSFIYYVGFLLYSVTCTFY